MRTDKEHESYRSSGKVNLLRLLAFTPFWLAALASIAWALFAASSRGWYIRFVMPAFAGILVGVATRWLLESADAETRGWQA
jgi:hypothetical protein